MSLGGSSPSSPSPPGLWSQTGLIPSPSLTTVLAAAGVGFCMCCASVGIVGAYEQLRHRKPPWDDIERKSSAGKFWTYFFSWTGAAVCCGIVAAAISLLPLLPLAAVGIAPRASLKILGGGALEVDGQGD